jgi:hypothetical protein
MATVASGLNSGSGFNSSDTITSTTLNNHVNNATVTGIVNDDVASNAAVAVTKLATITSQNVLGNIGAGNASVPIVGATGLLLDEDDFATDSNTKGATQQSIKAYIASIGKQFFHLQQKNNSGDQSSDTLVANTYTKRNVTSQGNNISGASVSSGVITLPAGTYQINAFANARSDGDGITPHRLRLRNTSDSTTTILGAGAVNCGQTGFDFDALPTATLQGYVTIGATKNFELQHFKGGSGNVAGGFPIGSGESEVHADILIRKVD